MGGVVAGGHPLTAEAGARTLRAGGNAVDAAVAACLMSFACESPLTGPGAGGFMLVHTAEGESTLLDFFVAAPGCGLAPAARIPCQTIVNDATSSLQRAQGSPRPIEGAFRRPSLLPPAPC